MDVTKLKRDPKVVIASLKTLPDGRVVTLTGCHMHIPAEYVDKQIAFLSGTSKSTLGIFALVVGTSYGVWSTPNMYTIEPQEYTRIMIDGAEYVECYFPEGSTVFTTLNVIMMDSLAYEIYDLYADTDIDPWFLSYFDRAAILDDTGLYLGATFGAKWSILKMVWAFTARSPKDRTKYWRNLLKTQQDTVTIKPSYIPFKSVIYGPKTTTAKLMGAYFDLGLNAALVNPSEKSDDMEKMLRL